MEQPGSTRTHLSWLNPNVAVADSEVAGHGVVVTEPISEGDIVAVFGGHILTGEELQAVLKKDPEFKYPVQVEVNHWLGPVEPSELEPADFVNHSCLPNCGMRGQITLVAMRDLSVGEEATFDYAMTETKYLNMDCSCGTDLCRGTITYNDWKLPELQRRYAGYFSSYIAHLDRTQSNCQ